MADFTGKKIKDTYHRIVQYHDGQFKDGYGFAISASVGSLSGSLSGSFEGHFSGSLTGSFSGTFDGATSSSFASRINTNETNITSLQLFSSSLDDTYATDAQVGQATSSLSSSLSTSIIANTTLIDGLTNKTGSYTTTGSNIFKDNQFITGSDVVLMVGDNHWDTGSATIYAKEGAIDLWLEQDSDDGEGPHITFFKARGGTAGEAPAIIGDEIFNISGRVYKSSSTAQGDDVTLNDWITLSQIQSKVQTAESASYGSEMIFKTVKSGSTELENIIIIDQEGTINLNEKIMANDQFIAADRLIASGSVSFSASLASKFGNTELNQNDTRAFLLAYGSGSGNGNAVLNVRRNTSGSTTAILHANQVEIARVRGNVSIGNVSSSIAITGSSIIHEGDTIISGTIDSNGATNKIRFLYSTLGDLPAASTYHGMFAHVHAEGAGYFAHAGNWVKLANDSDKVNNSATASFATTGSNTFTENQIVSASQVLTLQPSNPAPTLPATGSLIVSGSPVQLYIFNGSGSTGWNRT